jgi:hypothetical protein
MCPLLARHHPVSGKHAVDDPTQVDVDGPLEVGECHLAYLATDPDPRVVEHQVQVAVFLGGPLHELSHRFGVPHVEGGRRRPTGRSGVQLL